MGSRLGSGLLGRRHRRSMVSRTGFVVSVISRGMDRRCHEGDRRRFERERERREDLQGP